MNRFRKCLMLALTALALVVPAAAQAHPPQSGGMTAPRPQQSYAVYYRSDCNSSWVYYYTFRDRYTAQRYATWIESSYGYEVFVR